VAESATVLTILFGQFVPKRPLMAAPRMGQGRNDPENIEYRRRH